MKYRYFWITLMITTLIIILMIVLPFVLIWSISQLWGLHLEYSFINWLAAFLLIFLLNGGRKK